MVPEISGRPLTAAAEDQARYVRRDADDVVERAIRFAVNTVLASPRGMGATSLLYRLEGAYSGRTTYLGAAGGRGGLDVLETLGDRLATGALERAVGRVALGDPLDALRRRL